MHAHIDLSPELIRRIARGNPANLPRFMVHDDTVWPWGVVRLDTLQRIHLRRTDFLSVVAPQIPTRAGVWHRVDLQEFVADLSPDQLGGDGTQAKGAHSEYRQITEDRRLCPECGSWMVDMTHGRGRFCERCSYGHGGGTIPESEYR
jgi:ribosomal protein S27AE